MRGDRERREELPLEKRRDSRTSRNRFNKLLLYQLPLMSILLRLEFMMSEIQMQPMMELFLSEDL